MSRFIKKVLSYVSPFRSLVYVSLAAWVTHIILRVLLLFRSNPYGFPFVSKPDWYIFHAICIDFIWICKALIVFFIAGIAIKAIPFGKATGKFAWINICPKIYGIFHGLIIFLQAFDHEMQRFLGCHMSFGIANTYKDGSSLLMLWDYVGNDLSIPYLQVFLLFTMFPFTYFAYRFLKRREIAGKKTIIAMVVFYIASSLFVNVIWTGNARMAKLKPMVSIIYEEIFSGNSKKSMEGEVLASYTASYQNMWQDIEEDSLWIFPKDAPNPTYRVPSEALTQDSSLLARRAEKPNFIVVFMESHRGLNTGFLNPGEPSPTPFLDSLAAHSRIWERMFTSGLPTTGGVLSTHAGIPHHSYLQQATELTHVTIPSYASVMRDSGYVAHYFSAADPAWDNLGVWMSKWYSAQHYNRNREDDSTFFDHASAYVLDTLSKEGKPFLATLATRSNHYPFNFAAGMTDEEKARPLTERIKVTMNYADRQLARFIHSLEQQSWYQNTYVIVLADHGFPLGENGVSTMNGGGFSNATWVPFLIHGKNLDAARDTITTAQLDIAPTILELAGFAVPNMFMGHNLLRGYGKGLSLGAYFGVAAVGKDGYRLISKYPVNKNSTTWLFAEEDTHQNKDLNDSLTETVNQMKNILDTLVKISDFSLEHGI